MDDQNSPTTPGSRWKPKWWESFWSATSLPRWVTVVLYAWATLSAATDLVPVVSIQDDPGVSPFRIVLSSLLVTFALPLSSWRSPVGGVVLMAGLVMALDLDKLLFGSLFIGYVVLVIISVTASYSFLVFYAVLLSTMQTVYLLEYASDPYTGWVIYTAILLVVALGWQIARWRRSRDSAMKALEAEKEAHRLAAENERKAISQDLHDVVAHNMTIVRMHANMAKTFTDPKDIQECIDVILDASQESMHDLRVVMRALGSDAASTTSLDTSRSTWSVKRESEQFEKRLGALGYRTEMLVRGDLEAIDNSTQAGLVPIMREALSNIVKHADPPAADGSVDCEVVLDFSDPNEVVFRVTNPYTPPSAGRRGRRVPTAFSGGYGLSSLGERARVLGGWLISEPQGRRWVLAATLPTARYSSLFA